MLYIWRDVVVYMEKSENNIQKETTNFRVFSLLLIDFFYFLLIVLF